jgi:hypothetical protein
MNLINKLPLVAAISLLPLMGYAQDDSALGKLDEKLNPEKIFKGKITEADIDLLANAFKSALAGKPVALPEDFKQRILAIAESMKAEITPLMGGLIDEVAKSAKESVRGEKL